MTRRCLLTVLRYILHCSLLELIQRMWLPQRGCWRHRLSLFLSLPNNQQPFGLFFHICCIPSWSGDFLQSYFCFYCNFCCCFLNSLTLCGRNFHTCYIFPWRTCYSCFSIIFPAFNARTFSTGSFFPCLFSSVQFCLPEPTYLFLQIFRFHLCNINVSRYSYWLVFFR